MIFIENWIKTNILKLLGIPLSSTVIAEVFVLSSTDLLLKQLLIKMRVLYHANIRLMRLKGVIS